MNKTFPTNINGRVYYIDEDAYTLLKDYLHQLHITFGGEEGLEIVGDIEARIAELFDERIAAGAAVITIADVNRVIERMGRPEELNEGYESGSAESPVQEEKPFVSINLPVRKRLFRNMQNKVFGGVISGLGTYLGWDITIIRVAVVLLALFTYFWPLCVIYLVAWMIIPPARTSKQILEMYGEPVNVETVGQTVLQQSADLDSRASELKKANKRDGFGTFVRVCANCLMGFIGALALLCGIALGVGMIAILAAMVVTIFSPGLPGIDAIPGPSPYLALWLAFSVLGFLIIPCIALTWVAACSIFNAPSAGGKAITSLVVTAVIFLIVSIVLGVMLCAFVG